jgi:hypothetical protein
VLNDFISCATGISRLSRPELVTGLLGAKHSETQELTPLTDLVVPPECRELVRHSGQVVADVEMMHIGSSLGLGVEGFLHQCFGSSVCSVNGFLTSWL